MLALLEVFLGHACVFWHLNLGQAVNMEQLCVQLGVNFLDALARQLLRPGHLEEKVRNHTALQELGTDRVLVVALHAPAGVKVEAERDHDLVGFDLALQFGHEFFVPVLSLLLFEPHHEPEHAESLGIKLVKQCVPVLAPLVEHCLEFPLHAKYLSN